GQFLGAVLHFPRAGAGALRSDCKIKPQNKRSGYQKDIRIVSDHQQTPERGLEREITPSPFPIDFGGMYVKIARFHKA
ncbi:MAG: hypothetical protein IJB25_00780, partial [Clostridia bacterium]|nr:hypothetical protein [Clostridia bacterium]